MLLTYRKKIAPTLHTVHLAQDTPELHLALSGVRVVVEDDLPRVFGGLSDHWSIQGDFIPTAKVQSGMSLADAEAVARYQGDEYEVIQRPSGIWGVVRKPLSVAPDFGSTIVQPLTTRINTKRAD